MNKIIIFGATSGISMACAELWASQGHELFLVARNQNRLDALKQDLQLRYSKATIHILASELTLAKQEDTCTNTDHIFKKASQTMGYVDRVLISYGVLGDDDKFQKIENFLEFTNINFVSQASIAQQAMTHLPQGSSIAVITSVAGDRGRYSNYLYGSTKAALSTFLEGLRAQCFEKKITVLDIKPGFIETAMTNGFKKNFLWSSPQKIAPKIDSALRKNSSVVYVPGFWQWIMLVIKMIPNFIFKKLKF